MKKYIRNLSVFNKTVLFSTLIVVALGVISLAISYQVQKKDGKRDTNAARVNYGRFMEGVFIYTRRNSSSGFKERDDS